MRKNTGILILLLTFLACKDIKQIENKESNQLLEKVSSIEDKINNLKNSNNKEIIVVAHRGDWRNAPENSLQAIDNCIKMGVDMVEIDIRETKDGQLVLMHDKTIDRTTTGEGLLKEWTLDSLKTVQLIDGLGVPTQHKIPTLKEALLLAKDKVLINLDKSYNIFDKCYEVIKETETQNQVVIKGGKRLATVEKEFGKYLDKVHFMPIIHLPSNEVKTIVNEYMSSKHPPIAFEFTVKHDTIKYIEEFKAIRKSGASIWVNSLWSQHNGGHDDERAVKNQNVYQWYIENGIDIIQTDRPELLIKYLRSKNLHN